MSQTRGGLDIVLSAESRTPNMPAVLAAQMAGDEDAKVTPTGLEPVLPA